MYDEKNSDIGMTVGKMLRNQKVVIYPNLLTLKQRDCACIVIYLSVTTVKKYNDPTVHARIKKKSIYTKSCNENFIKINTQNLQKQTMYGLIISIVLIYRGIHIFYFNRNNTLLVVISE